MPKIRHMDTKGLVQESGSGVTFEQGQITRTISALTNTITTVGRNANTSTDTGITPAAGSRILGWKVEILSVTGNPAGNLADLGFKGGDVDAIADGFDLDASVVGTARGAALTAARDADASGAELLLTHTAPGAADVGSEVRITVLVETFA